MPNVTGASGTDGVDAMRRRHELAGRNIDLFLRETVEMETVHALDMFAQIVTAFAAGFAQPAGARAIDRDQLAGQHVGYARTDGFHHTRGFRTDCERHLALGESHAAPAPNIDVVERHGLDAQRYLARRRRIRFGQIHFSSFRSSTS